MIKNKEPKKEISAGIILFRKEKNQDNKEIKFLLLHYPQGHWDFPKGHVEEGEELIDAAIRETKEETGIDEVKIYENFHEQTSYYYTYNGERRYKIVHYFLGETKQKEVRLSHEHIGYAWLNHKETKNRITYENTKKIFEKAWAKLEKVKYKDIKI